MQVFHTLDYALHNLGLDPQIELKFFCFVFYSLSLYSLRHLTYKWSRMANPLHALQATNMVFLLLLGKLAHFFRSSIMHFESSNKTAVRNHEGALFIAF